MYIELKTGTPDMVGKGESGTMVLQGGVTNGVANVLWHKNPRGVKPKKFKIM